MKIFITLQYLELYEKDNSFAEAFFQKANNFFYLPYIKNQIAKKLLSEDYFDFETAYECNDLCLIQRIKSS